MSGVAAAGVGVGATDEAAAGGGNDTAVAVAEALIARRVLERDSPEHHLFCGLSPRRARRFDAVLQARTASVAVVLDGVHGAHNLAAVCRTCDAFGVQHVHFIPASAGAAMHQRGAAEASETDCRSGDGGDSDGGDAWERRRQAFLHSFFSASAADVSRGAHKWLSLHVHGTVRECVEHLRREGYTVCATSVRPRRTVPLHEVTFAPRGGNGAGASQAHDEPSADADAGAGAVGRLALDGPRDKLAFVFGNEHSGVAAEMESLADVLFTVPMCGFVESLNISVTAACVLQHATVTARQMLPPEVYSLREDEMRTVLRSWLLGHGANDAERAAKAKRRYVTGDDASGADDNSKSEFTTLGRQFENAVLHRGLFNGSADREALPALRVDGRFAARLRMYIVRRKAGALGDSGYARRCSNHVAAFAGLLAVLGAASAPPELGAVRGQGAGPPSGSREHALSTLPSFRNAMRQVNELFAPCFDASGMPLAPDSARSCSRFERTCEQVTGVAARELQKLEQRGGQSARDAFVSADARVEALRFLGDMLRVRGSGTHYGGAGARVSLLRALDADAYADRADCERHALVALGVRLLHCADVAAMLHRVVYDRADAATYAEGRTRRLHDPRYTAYELMLGDAMRGTEAEEAEEEDGAERPTCADAEHHALERAVALVRADIERLQQYYAR